MIEKIVLDYLTEQLTVPVYMEVPADPPASFVLLEKTGSNRANRIRRATLAVQSWAGTMLAAAALNEQVKAAMDDLPDLDSVSAAALNNDYNYTDTDSKFYRYQAVYEVTYY